MSQITYKVVVIRDDGKEIYNKTHQTEEAALKDMERIENIITKHKMNSKYGVMAYPEIIIEKEK